MNKLVRHNLVRGIPTKCFENDHTCTAFLKRKQHKASLKIIRCDNGGEFRNKEMNDFCSQKGIKREFSNARTPQQNGVAERRNRTLIEAARTMLAYAKLPVTFWAKAVNTACYVQNRVLINKSHNKTSYELFNGRSPAIGILKSFGCHVMILNTLDNLGKFEKKRDEGYFIGYSMSSKAFRVFNKRTRRVEENLHVEFLENKAIEKGVGPNWLFDIDSLTISMNYVPVDAGTISTNILETPSLDNILTLTNRFEDILRVTTNSDEANGVEADVSNIEITIIASPTPTLEIHKDHPKS
nr:retrovirus-related Pol polyprotein from transposon TNT 1-94 [Tanacetum cinerariifolium]